MKIKKGFSIAELVIALGIVAVISAVTIPSLVKNTDKAKGAGNVSRAIEQIRVGCEAMKIADFEQSASASFAETLDTMDLQFNQANIRRYMAVNVGPAISVNTYEGNAVNIGAAQSYRFQKFNTDFALVRTAIPAAQNGAPNAIYADLYIDMNGFQKGRNRLGQDVFLFHLKNDGKIIPEGIAANCTTNNIRNGGRDCSAKLVADSFRIRYY